MNWQETHVKFKTWWSALTTREKQIVSAGAGLVLFLLFYLVIWSPFLDHLNVLRKRVVADQKTILWMQAAQKQIHTLENRAIHKSKPVSVVTLLGLVQKQINLAGLSSSLTQLKQATPDSIEIHFQKVEFDPMMRFLIKLIKEQPIAVQQMTVLAQTTPGVVNADVVIKR